MAWYLGIDTSNYTTSAALYNSTENVIRQQKKLLPVRDGALGLKQSDAVFHHVKQLGPLLKELFDGEAPALTAVGVSSRPRNVDGSYMPCFLVGESAGTGIAAATGRPLHRFSHQEGHIVAALWSVGRLDLLQKEFVAFHLSGGTTEGLYCHGGGKGLEITRFSATTDLNAGQGIDRVGLMLGLHFPCGPQLEKLALQAKRHHSPRPSFQGANPSISGLENQCARMLEQGERPQEVARYATEYIHAVVVQMTQQALNQFGQVPLLYAGGVMSNSIISQSIGSRFGGLFAAPAFSSDNAAGIAVLAAAEEGEKWQA